MNIHEYLIDIYVEKYGKHINHELADTLVEEMAVTDGSSRETGQKWTLQETKDVGSKLGVNFEEIKPCEWYLVMNMMYSDHYRTGKKHGFIDPTFYGELALDWFHDVDGNDDKTFKYFMY